MVCFLFSVSNSITQGSNNVRMHSNNSRTDKARTVQLVFTYNKAITRHHMRMVEVSAVQNFEVIHPIAKTMKHSKKHQ